MTKCNHNCFECEYSDCINDDYTKEDFDRQNEFEFDECSKKHSNEKDKQSSRNYYWNNREKCLEKNKKYYQTHKEKFKEYDRIRKKTHPISKEKRHEYYIRFRDKKRAKENK